MTLETNSYFLIELIPFAFLLFFFKVESSCENVAFPKKRKESQTVKGRNFKFLIEMKAILE